MNVKEGTFSRMVFSISRLEGSHQAGFTKVSFVAGLLLPFQVSLK